MQRLAALTALVLALTAGRPAAQELCIGGFDLTRTTAPLAQSTGTLGYAQLRSSLLDPARFGPGGTVPCTVTIDEGTDLLTDEYLADKDVFFASYLSGPLSPTEQDAIAAFVARGGSLIVDGDSSNTSIPNQFLSAIGAMSSLGTNGCPNLNAGGTVAGPDPVTNGPFGDVSGQSFGTSLTSLVTGSDPRQVDLVTCAAGEVARSYFPRGALSAKSGLVLFGGDPSAVDLFTSPSSGFYNPTNEVLYLNAIARAAAAFSSSYGSGLAGTLGVPTIRATAQAIPGATATIEVGSSLGVPAEGLLLIGGAALAADTDRGGTLLVAAERVLGIPLSGPTVEVDLAIPNTPALVKRSLFAQALVPDPGAPFGVAFSPGLELEVGLP